MQLAMYTTGKVINTNDFISTNVRIITSQIFFCILFEQEKNIRRHFIWVICLIVSMPGAYTSNRLKATIIEMKFFFFLLFFVWIKNRIYRSFFYWKKKEIQISAILIYRLMTNTFRRVSIPVKKRQCSLLRGELLPIIIRRWTCHI